MVESSGIAYRLVQSDMLRGHRSDRELVLHPIPAGATEPPAQIFIIDQHRDGVSQFIRVFRRYQQSRFTVCHRFDETAGLQGLLEEIQREAEQQETVLSGAAQAESRELHPVTKTERRRLRAQLTAQVAVAEDNQTDARVLVAKVGDGLQEIAVSLAWDQLTTGTDR